MNTIRTVCVYCGSAFGASPQYREAAIGLGTTLAREGITLIYGGGGLGLMGTVAQAAMDAGGKVVGIIPDHLYTRERHLEGLTENIVVSSMHERKALMVARSDGFVALPGGLGTLDELVEISTWRQLSLHNKPIVILNTGGFWQRYQDLLTHMVEEGFVQAAGLEYARPVNTVAEVLPALRAG